MVGISGTTRRVAAAVALCALAAPFVGPAPSVASSPGTQSAHVEALCPAPTPGTAQCFALRRTDIAARPASAVSPLTPPSGYGPADLQSAYALPTGSAGSGLTVAVVDAYDLPTAEADLAVYRTQFGLPPCTTANGCFQKVDQNGGTSYPIANAGWAAEIALDMDMVSASCPNCKILLVEAGDRTTPAGPRLASRRNTRKPWPRARCSARPRIPRAARPVRASSRVCQRPAPRSPPGTGPLPPGIDRRAAVGRRLWRSPAGPQSHAGV